MKRILITGNAGSGKTTLARRVAERLDLPCSSLDTVVWRSGWKKTPPEERAEMIREMIRPGAWVIDGVSPEVQEAADTVVFLDVPRRISFRRVCVRNWRYLFRSRPELPPGCPEILIIPTLCRIIWNFPRTVRPRILRQAAEAEATQRFHHLRTGEDVERFLAELAVERPS